MTRKKTQSFILTNYISLIKIYHNCVNAKISNSELISRKGKVILPEGSESA